MKYSITFLIALAFIVSGCTTNPANAPNNQNANNPDVLLHATASVDSVPLRVDSVARFDHGTLPILIAVYCGETFMELWLRDSTQALYLVDGKHTVDLTYNERAAGAFYPAMGYVRLISSKPLHAEWVIDVKDQRTNTILRHVVGEIK